MTTAFTVEPAGADERSFLDAFGLLLELHKVGGYALLDEDKAIAQTYEALLSGAVFLARHDGKAIGILAMAQIEFWYSKRAFLQSFGFYVKPEFRGVVGARLLRAAREEARARNMLALVTIDNPDRRRKATSMSVVALEAGFVPLGYTLMLNSPSHAEA